jgi:signal transduction histidine kinase
LPRSLFLKIFLWFVTVVLTVIVGTFIVAELSRPEPFASRRPESIDSGLNSYAQTSTEIYEREGPQALAAYLDRIHDESDMHVFLFDDQGQSLTSHKVPPSAPGLAHRVLETKQPISDFPPLMARPFVTPQGKSYALVVEMPMRRRSSPWNPSGPILHLFGIGLIGALFCYWLARYLTSPVAKLRAATQQLARGNLQTRVGPAIGKRQDELASLGADFDVMAEQIEALVNSQRRLLGDISHELRSPLARLSVALELAGQTAGPAAASALERIRREAENLNEMIGQLLALTRMESGTEGLRTTELNLQQLVEEIVDDADFEARSRNRSVRLEALEPGTVNGNEQLLRRAIENVVRNAVQYTAKDTEVLVQLRLDSCESLETAGKVGGKRNTSDRCAVVTVRDRGAGVPDSALTKIFDPFYRVDEARDREAGGVGLGLAITDRAVRLHGGTVTAANAAAGGLIVTIMIPVSRQRTADS